MAVKFKLQTVLKYRKTLENQAQQRFAELLAVEAQLQQKQLATRTQLENLSQQLEIKQQQGLSVPELQLYDEQIRFQRKSAEQCLQELSALRTQLEQRRQELLAAARETKVIEKLKEKQLAEYLRKLDRQERNMLDEISLRQKGG